MRIWKETKGSWAMCMWCNTGIALGMPMPEWLQWYRWVAIFIISAGIILFLTEWIYNTCQRRDKTKEEATK